MELQLQDQPSGTGSTTAVIGSSLDAEVGLDIELSNMELQQRSADHSLKEKENGEKHLNREDVVT